MAKKETTSELFSGNNELATAAVAARGKAVDLKFGGQLPGGIENGIAELRELKFGKYGPDTKWPGKPFFLGQAIVLFPKELKGQRVEGLFTKIGPEPLFDTATDANKDSKGRKSFQDHYNFMRDHLVQLGWKEPDLSGKSSKQVAEIIQAAMDELCKKAPRFRFRTWQGGKQVIAQDDRGKWQVYNEFEGGSRKKIPGKSYSSEEAAKRMNPYAGREPLVNHVWGDLVTDYQPSANGHVQDDSAPVYESGNGDDDGVTTTTEDSADTFDEFGSLDDLLDRADSDDTDAQIKLMEMAVAAGYSEEDVSSADVTWDQVVEMIKSPKDADTAPEEDGCPNEKDVVKFRPLDKSGKPGKIAVQCEVLMVDKKNKTCDLKSLRDGKTLYRDVKWDALIA